jgi:hypothetical protein
VRADVARLQRVANLQGVGTGVRLNGLNLLTWETTVTTEGVANTLVIGEVGQVDWFPADLTVNPIP